jgi:hypothetical protein
MDTSKTHPKFLHLSPGSDRKICEATLTRQSPVLSMTTAKWAEKVLELRDSHPRLSLALKDWVFPYETIFDYFRATKDQRFLSSEPLSGPQLRDSESDVVSFCEVELQLLTGRTHQLRAQMQALGGGVQIAGDRIYHSHLDGALPGTEMRKQLRPQFVSSPHLSLQVLESSLLFPPSLTAVSRPGLSGLIHRF